MRNVNYWEKYNVTFKQLLCLSKYQQVENITIKDEALIIHPNQPEEEGNAASRLSRVPARQLSSDVLQSSASAAEKIY